jgi:hypothetical protein
MQWGPGRLTPKVRLGIIREVRPGNLDHEASWIANLWSPEILVYRARKKSARLRTLHKLEIPDLVIDISFNRNTSFAIGIGGDQSSPRVPGPVDVATGSSPPGVR